METPLEEPSNRSRSNDAVRKTLTTGLLVLKFNRYQGTKQLSILS